MLIVLPVGVDSRLSKLAAAVAAEKQNIDVKQICIRRYFNAYLKLSSSSASRALTRWHSLRAMKAMEITRESIMKTSFVEFHVASCL